MAAAPSLYHTTVFRYRQTPPTLLGIALMKMINLIRTHPTGTVLRHWRAVKVPCLRIAFHPLLLNRYRPRAFVLALWRKISLSFQLVLHLIMVTQPVCLQGQKSRLRITRPLRLWDRVLARVPPSIFRTRQARCFPPAALPVLKCSTRVISLVRIWVMSSRIRITRSDSPPRWMITFIRFLISPIHAHRYLKLNRSDPLKDTLCLARCLPSPREKVQSIIITPGRMWDIWMSALRRAAHRIWSGRLTAIQCCPNLSMRSPLQTQASWSRRLICPYHIIRRHSLRTAGVDMSHSRPAWR